jgi:alkylation response protein AidB-like acyl-CoA dehydrogenase
VAHVATETVCSLYFTSICPPTYLQYFSGLLGGKVIGLPPVLNFGSEALKARIVPEVMSGQKFICLAISEAHAGSDVLGLQTSAVKTADGKEWIVNGTKKWITNGT